jgi:dTDP-4-dehydrorhamnose reductase
MPVPPKNILILGAGGRLAGSLAECWRAHHKITALRRPELNVADPDALERLLDSHEFDVLVNGTGLTNVDRCEQDREEARVVNTVAPGVMARCAEARGARLIHFSTDYVFDGTQREPYTETDTAHPCGWYGITKLDGENEVLAAGSVGMVVRVSWVFGLAKPSFVDALISRAQTEDQVEAIADKFSSPTSAVDVAEWMEPFFNLELPGGLYHACNSGHCSWQEYGAHALAVASEAGVPLRTTTVAPIRLADMKQFIAPRPIFSILSTRKLTSVTGISPRHWRDALRDYIFKKHAPLSPTP